MTVSCPTVEPFMIPDVDVELTVPKTVSLMPTYRNSDALPYLACTTYTVTTDDQDGYITVDGSGNLVVTISDNALSASSITRTVTIAVTGEVGTTFTTSVTINIYGCDELDIIPFTVSPLMFDLGQSDSITLAPTATTSSFVPTLACPLSISTIDATSLISTSGLMVTASTSDVSLLGTQTRTITVTKTGPGTDETLDITVMVIVRPSCFASTI